MKRIARPISRGVTALLALSLSGCAAEEAGDAGTAVVGGLTTDLAVGFDIHRIEITTAVDGEVKSEERRSYTEGNLTLPTELSVDAGGSADVEITAEAFGKAEPQPFLTRTAATRAAPGRALLLPLSLEQACSGVACPAGKTCIQGACADPFVDPSALDEADPSWLDTAPDACKTPSSGEPSLEIGQGLSAFAALGDGEEVSIEPGAQGGHHVWLALRVRGLRQMGSHLTVGGALPDLDVDLVPVTTVATLRRAEEGRCEVYGVRLRVDAGLPVDTLLGTALNIDVRMEDPNGDVAVDEKQVRIAPDAVDP
jgi:hypothetical protein